jgi:hypothetical protein
MSKQTRTPTKLSENPGPYLATVVNHLDPKTMGALEVELLKTSDSGNMTERTGQIVQVQYLSPFYGVTPYKDLTKNDGYKYTQKSYGMWFVPPDVGTNVLVIFAEGNFSQGYWIGCVQDEYMNFMVPGYAATSFNDKSTAQKLPVGEYNKKVETAKGRDATKFIKPHSPDLVSILEEQGLLADETRGTTTSSARREAPSHVFGISTPGPQDKRPGAPRGKYGLQGSQSDVPASRLGGSSFVMDDGDASLVRKGPASTTPPEYANVEGGESGDPTLPHNELVRIRTRTGHQILLHNTEDLIYIGNARGTTWIEMTSNGKIDIYAKDSVSIHTEADINLKADKNVNIQAGENVNIKAGADGKITTDGDLHLNSDPAAEVSREPMHEPWAGHENLHGTEPFPTQDTFRKPT